MEKFSRTLRGYDPDEVNAFLDEVIKRMEEMVEELNISRDTISSLKGLEEENQKLKEKVERYSNMEETINKTIVMAQKTSDQLKMSAHHDSQYMLDDAKRNADRIVNEALLRAEKIEHDATMTLRNTKLFKRRLKSIIESQLELVDEIETLDL